ncbi:hypothetical protein HRI_004673500 [Hibiscus trionum]|uniref:NB-ARC domain-containing protein n=1 Tax=Hibiscus trionum TaxID=183268 RepID=A0A9W7MM40_HIBTR|nr:hypothetical protein HRI_004673500 [Hibiscus trionum]
MELVGPIFDVLKCLGDPTCRYIDHHRKLEERKNDLQGRLDQLNAIKRDVEQRIKAELRRGKRSREEVEQWLLDAQAINGQMQDIDERMQNVSCFSRARLGKRVAQMVEQVEELIDRGRFTEPLVIDNPSTSGVAFQLEHLEGETIVKDNIWNFLMGDEIGMIGVCGMGGIGKSTIMKHIYNQLLKTKPLFDEIIWVTVSKELNITKLQKDIADVMHISGFPESESERVAMLMEELGRRRYVLILDDVWEVFSLLKVGIPKPTSSNGSKLVLTSRSIEVCRSMDCKIVQVPPLSNEESMNLFLEHAGRGVLLVPSLEEILRDIVRECDGLPLAIAVIAGSMKGIDDVAEWRNALRELRYHVRSVKGTDVEIYERLKFSFDRLRDLKIQNCFLFCSLYPEDYIIPRMELIEYWIDDRFLGTGSRQELYDRGHTILNRLVNNCLLEKDGRDNVKMHDVMRDTALYIKSVAPRFLVKAGITLKELPSRQEWEEDLEKVSFMVNNVSEIPPDLTPNCENLSTLLLQKNQSLERIPDSFFQHMHSLNILDLSYTYIEQLPNSVSNLEKLNALVLRGCYNLRYVPSLEKLKSLRKLNLCRTAIEKLPEGLEMLTNLTYLNVSTECLKELPIAILPKLSCLQCLVLYVESNSVKMNGFEAARLRKLEIFEGRFNELMDFNAYSKSILGRELTSYLLVMAPLEAKFDAKPLVEGLTHVFRFKMDLPGVRNSNKVMKTVAGLTGVETVSINRGKETILEVSGGMELRPIKIAAMLKKRGFQVQLVDEWELPFLTNKKVVILSGFPIGRDDPPVQLPSDVRCLRIFECLNIRSLSDMPFFQQTNELSSCSIQDCRGIESVLDLSSSSQPCTPFQNLELLWLGNLDNLRMLVKVAEASVVSTSSSLPMPGIFSHLKSFQIERCSNIKLLFPFELAQDLQNLEKLVVRDCGRMEKIIGSEEAEESHRGKGTDAPTKLSLTKLRKLELKNLTELKSICSSNRAMLCDSLVEIEVWECKKLKRMPLYLPLFQDIDQSVPSAHPFKHIRICPKEWWKSVEWDYPNAKEVLQPHLLL